MTSCWKQLGCLWLALFVVPGTRGWAEDAKSPEPLTIIGRKDGTFLVVEQDGTKEEVAAKSLTLGAIVSERVIEQGKARAERATEEATEAAAQAEEVAAQQAAQEAALKEAAEKAAKQAAAAKRRVEAEKERQVKIWDNYDTKHHAYGPNSVPEVKLDDELEATESDKGASTAAK